MHDYIITCSLFAIEKAREAIIKRNKETYGIRLALRAGGCNGFELIVEFAEKLFETDCFFTFNDVIFVIDKKSIVYLNNTHIDYKVELMKHGFHFTIPKQLSGCTCGKSISF